MKNTNKPEIIEVKEVQVGQNGRWELIKNRVKSMSKKSIIFLSLGAVALIIGGFVLAEIYDDKMDVMEDKIEQELRQQAVTGIQKSGDRGIITNGNDTSVGNPVASSSEAATATQPRVVYGVNIVDSSELDGTYTAQVGYDSYTLTIKGNQGTLLEVESDGDQNLEEVIFDLEKNIAYVDGDIEQYNFDGTVLTLTEVDRDIFDQDQITFTRQ